MALMFRRLPICSTATGLRGLGEGAGTAPQRSSPLLPPLVSAGSSLTQFCVCYEKLQMERCQFRILLHYAQLIKTEISLFPTRPN